MGARRGANQHAAVRHSDITAVGSSAELANLDMSRPHCTLGVQFYMDSTGSTVATPTAGTLQVQYKTYNTNRYETHPYTIDAANPSTLSWTANTVAVKVNPTGVDVATHYRVVVIENEDGVPSTIVDPLRYDSFGRQRVSEPTTLFDSKQIFDNQPVYWDDAQVSGSGTSSSWSVDTASSTLGVSASTAGLRMRQTFQRFNYQPGKSQLHFLTGNLALSGSGSGITTGMAVMDDNNGHGAVMIDGVVNLRRRSKVTGSVVDTDVPQAEWNADKLDGTGPSGLVFDGTKAQIFWFDMEWLGVGSVRMGFVINGMFVHCHTFHHANIGTTVYMPMPNLPVRYWIENDGTGGAATMSHICSTIISEGGRDLHGCLHYFSTGGTHVDAQDANSIYAVLGIRLRTTHIGQVVDLVHAGMINSTNDDFEWLLMWNPTINGTFTYSDIPDTSLQGATGATENTVTGGHIMTGNPAQDNVNIPHTLENALRLGVAIDGTRDEIVLCVRPYSANADIEAGIGWREQG